MFEKCFKTTEKGTFKKENKKVEHFDVAGTRKVCRTWLGLGNEVARTPPLGYIIMYTICCTEYLYLRSVGRKTDHMHIFLARSCEYILQYSTFYSTCKLADKYQQGLILHNFKSCKRIVKPST